MNKIKINIHPPKKWSESVVRSLCFPMPPFQGLIKILLLLFCLRDQ